MKQQRTSYPDVLKAFRVVCDAVAYCNNPTENKPTFVPEHKTLLDAILYDLKLGELVKDIDISTTSESYKNKKGIPIGVSDTKLSIGKHVPTVFSLRSIPKYMAVKLHVGKAAHGQDPKWEERGVNCSEALPVDCLADLAENILNLNPSP